jgi:phage tail sheath gpL-like
MPLPDSTSLAAGVATRVNNKAFAVTASNLARKILLVGVYDEALTAVVPDVPVQVLSAADAASQFGPGYGCHRMALAAFRKNAGIPVYIAPQDGSGGSDATGTITITVTTAEAGTLHFYIGGIHDYVPVAVTAGDDVTNIADKISAAITADTSLPVTASNVAGVVTLVSKSAGTYGNFVTLTDSLKGETNAAGVGIAYVAMSGGETDPDVQDVLDQLGTGDAANADHYTSIVQGYGPVAAPMDAISTYNGLGNLAEGLFAPTVARPWRSINGHTVAGSAGLTAAKAIASGRELDRTNGLVPVPDSSDHPVEIACEHMADMESVSQALPAKSYTNRLRTWSTGDAGGDRWTDDYANRDDAKKNGVGSTLIQNGVITAQDTITFYKPDSVGVANNGYREMRNIAIVQNMIYNMQLLFKQDEWSGITIVEDVSVVSGAAKQNVKDVDAVLDALGGLANAFASQSWIWNSEFTKNNMEVLLRPAGNGFDTIFPVVLSAQGDIKNNEIQFDINLSIFL